MAEITSSTILASNIVDDLRARLISSELLGCVSCAFLSAMNLWFAWVTDMVAEMWCVDGEVQLKWRTLGDFVRLPEALKLCVWL